MLDVTIHADRVSIGRFSVTFERTLRIPDDGRDYPLPPGLGHFPVRRVADYADRVPAAWRAHGGVFLPMYQREAMWLNFHGAYWHPNAVKVAVGKVNAVSGEPYHDSCLGREDYVVVPPQPWLDGINAGDGYIRQFVAMPLGMGYTVEGQVTGEERHGGLQLVCFEPKPGRFPEQPPRASRPRAGRSPSAPARPRRRRRAEMGLGAGGRMRQQIYPDPHGVDTWDLDNYGRVFVHIVNSQCGARSPASRSRRRRSTPARTPTPACRGSTSTTTDSATSSASEVLANVKSITEKDADHGFVNQQDDSSIDVPNVKHLGAKKVPDGKW